MANIYEITHPLVQHKLTLMRMKDTSTVKFRTLMREIGMLLGYEVTRHLPTMMQEIETPVAKMHAPVLASKKMALVSVLRAGQGLLDGMLQLLPTARVGHIGLYRDVAADTIVEYYFKLPEDIAERDALVLDPMLATGHTAAVAVSRLLEAKPKSVRFVCLLAARQGIEYFQEHHPNVSVYTAGIDELVNQNGYIVPGIGDAGDRLFGTH